MPDATNIKGEQGGTFLSAGQSFTSTSQSNYGLGFLCITDVILTSVEMSGWDGTESELVGPTLFANTFVPGIIVELTPDSGEVAVLNH